MAYEPQIDALSKGVEILVGTPGRLLDLAKQKQLRLDRVARWCSTRPTACSTWASSTTSRRSWRCCPKTGRPCCSRPPCRTRSWRWPAASCATRSPIHAGHTAETGPSPLTKQVVYRTHSLNKVEMVARILQAEGRGLTMIFTRTKRAADRVAEDLDFRGFAVAAVHGDLGQGARERALRAFRAGKIDVLVATDVAARGLDVTGVTHVINYDCPEDPDTYTHRIGRTGRAGATGVAVTFVDWEDMPRWGLIDKSLGLDIPSRRRPTTRRRTSTPTSTSRPTSPARCRPPTRTRAGLSAEVEEDLGGRSSGRRSRWSHRWPRRRACGQRRPEQVPGRPGWIQRVRAGRLVTRVGPCSAARRGRRRRQQPYAAPQAPSPGRR